jgi:hypothetical protein
MKRGHHVTPKINIQWHALEYEWQCVQCNRFLEKRMLPEYGPVRLKHVVNVYILMTCETF